MARGNEEDEESRRMQLEVALEIKSLRRIISAYLNYPEAAEQDIRRYERSFRRLPPSHKALLPHLPLKYQKLRWCISENSYFIFEMLKAFEPPLDISQDIDIDENEAPGNFSDHQLFSGRRNGGSAEHASTNAMVSKAESDGHNHDSMEKSVEGLNKFNAGSCPVGSESPAEDACVDNQGTLSCNVGCNGHVRSQSGNFLEHHTLKNPLGEGQFISS